MQRKTWDTIEIEEEDATVCTLCTVLLLNMRSVTCFGQAYTSFYHGLLYTLKVPAEACGQRPNHGTSGNSSGHWQILVYYQICQGGIPARIDAGPPLTQQTIYTTYNLGRMPKNVLNWVTQKCNRVYCWMTTEYVYGLQLYIWTTSLLDCMWTMCSLLLIKAMHYNWPVSQNLLQSHLLWPIEQPETQWCAWCDQCYQETDTNTTSKLNQYTKSGY